MSNVDYDREGKPLMAVGMIENVTESKWMHELVHVLAQDYFELYYVRSESDSFDILRGDESTPRQLEISGGRRFSEAVHDYVDRYVHPEEKAMMHEFFSLDRIREYGSGSRKCFLQLPEERGRSLRVDEGEACKGRTRS